MNAAWVSLLSPLAENDPLRVLIEKVVTSDALQSPMEIGLALRKTGWSISIFSGISPGGDHTSDSGKVRAVPGGMGGLRPLVVFFAVGFFGSSLFDAVMTHPQVVIAGPDLAIQEASGTMDARA